VLTVEAPELPKPAWGPLWKAATEAPLEMDRRILRRTVARSPRSADALGDAAAPLLAEADRVGARAPHARAAPDQPVLPLAFSDRCHALAQQAAEGKAISAPTSPGSRATARRA
jgi:hypothetical protein